MHIIIILLLLCTITCRTSSFDFSVSALMSRGALSSTAMCLKRNKFDIDPSTHSKYSIGCISSLSVYGLNTYYNHCSCSMYKLQTEAISKLYTVYSITIHYSFVYCLK